MQKNEPEPVDAINGDRRPWAAYILGHHGYTLRVWHELYFKSPDDLGTEDSVPLAIEEIQEAVIELAHELVPMVATELKHQLHRLFEINSAMLGAWSRDDFSWFRGRIAPGDAVCDRISRLMRNVLPAGSEVSDWLAFGRVVGAYDLAASVPIEAAEVQMPREVVAAAQMLKKNWSHVPPVVERVANSGDLLDEAGPIRFFRSVLPNKKGALRLKGRSFWGCVVSHEMQRLHAEIDAGLRTAALAPIRGLTTSTGNSDDWFHQSRDDRPEKFKFGPLSGTKAELARWILPLSGKQDPRALESRARRQRVWIFQENRTSYEAYFEDERTWAAANQRRLLEQQQTTSLQADNQTA